MVQTREELGLTEAQAPIPIHAYGKMWTLLEAARYLYDARRDDDPNCTKVLALWAELARLRQEARDVGDMELLGAADALGKAARDIFAEKT